MTDRTVGAEQSDEVRAGVTQMAHRSHGSFEMVLSPALLALAGWWIDGRLGTGPWLLVLFAVLGLAGAVVKIVYGYRAEMATHREAALAARGERRDALLEEAA